MNQHELRELMNLWTPKLYLAMVLFHGFRASSRDYELIVGRENRPLRSFVFRYCVAAHVVKPLIDEAGEPAAIDPRAYHDDYRVWFTERNRVYPGWECVDVSKTAQEWTTAVGVEFHEVTITLDLYSSISLVFSDLVAETLSDPYGMRTIDDPPSWLSRFWDVE